jgi:hypothetical protein
MDPPFTQIFVKNDFHYNGEDKYGSTNITVLKIPKNVGNFSELALRMLVIYVELNHAAKINRRVNQYPFHFEDLIGKKNIFKCCSVSHGGRPVYFNTANILVNDGNYNCNLLLTPTREITQTEIENDYYRSSFMQMMRCLHYNI